MFYTIARLLVGSVVSCVLSYVFYTNPPLLIAWLLVGFVVSSTFAIMQIRSVRKMVEHGIPLMTPEERVEYGLADKSVGNVLDRRVFLIAIIASPAFWPYHFINIIKMLRG